MKKRLPELGFFSFFFLGSFVFSGHCAISLNPWVDSSLTFLVEQDYRAAQSVLNNVLAKDPRNIDALYMLVTLRQTQLLDYESYTVEGDQFLSLADSVLEIFESMKSARTEEDKVKLLFYTGNICGGKGLIMAKNGRWMLAVKQALNSVSLLKEVRAKDPTFYAAYQGLGVFNYYLSQNLKWAPFLGDKSKEGLRDIRKSTQARFPFDYAAKNSLAWILIERNDFAGADSIVSGVLSDYPDNTIFLRIKARIALWTGKYEEAVQHGLRLARLSYRRNPANWSDLFSGYQIVVESCLKKGDSEKSVKYAREALEFEAPVTARKIPYVRDHLHYLSQAANKPAE